MKYVVWIKEQPGQKGTKWGPWEWVATFKWREHAVDFANTNYWQAWHKFRVLPEGHQPK